MRQVVVVFLLTAGIVFSCLPASADVSLPAPVKEGGKGIFSSLGSRSSASGTNFPTGKVSEEELATLLWAATGLNRPGKGWTVPMGMSREPYCDVYVTGDEGTFRYDWKTHALVEISKENAKSTLGHQPFFTAASHVLLFVANGDALAKLNNQRGKDWTYVATGAMTQNVYLAADALGIGTRYIASFTEEAARSALKLPENDTPICAMPIGKK